MLRRDELLALKLVLRCMNVRVGRGVRSTKVDRTKLKEDRDGKTTKERKRRREGRGLDEEGEGGEISGRERQLWEHHKAPGSFSSLSLSLLVYLLLYFTSFLIPPNSTVKKRPPPPKNRHGDLSPSLHSAFPPLRYSMNRDRSPDGISVFIGSFLSLRITETGG